MVARVIEVWGLRDRNTQIRWMEGQEATGGVAKGEGRAEDEITPYATETMY